MPRFFLRRPSLPGFGLSFGVSVLYLSLIILLPIAGLLIYTSDMTWTEYWRAITDPRVVASYRVTLSAAFLSTVFATTFGLLLAWIIVRYEFPGKRVLDSLVDLPFALPTAVAGLTLALLLSPPGWLGQFFTPDSLISRLFFDSQGFKIAYAYPGMVIAMIFTSLPFVVRSVQPVLADVGPEYEEAARTLGARDGQILRRVILPALSPAIMTGASQAFIRSLGEFGAVVMIAGNLPFRTEITSLLIFTRQAENNYPAAAAIASVVLFVSLLLLFGLRMAQKRLLPWYRTEV